MTQDEFTAKYRPLLLGWMTECFAMRAIAPSAFGMMMDGKYQNLERLLLQMFIDAQPKPAPARVIPEGPVVGVKRA
jgi:hypothetical protein